MEGQWAKWCKRRKNDKDRKIEELLKTLHFISVGFQQGHTKCGAIWK